MATTLYIQNTGFPISQTSTNIPDISVISSSVSKAFNIINVPNADSVDITLNQPNQGISLSLKNTGTASRNLSAGSLTIQIKYETNTIATYISAAVSIPAGGAGGVGFSPNGVNSVRVKRNGTPINLTLSSTAMNLNVTSGSTIRIPNSKEMITEVVSVTTHRMTFTNNGTSYIIRNPYDG